ncbi:MAG: imidazolonepropionase [Saprospiraceae bacterium]
MSSLLIHSIKGLALAESEAPLIKRGLEMANLTLIEDAWVLCEDGLITSFGQMADCPDRADVSVDAKGRFLLPTWVDSHTHIVYAASREHEFVDRIKGHTYEEIALKGGGILNSAAKLRVCPESQLFDDAWQRLEEVIQSGTGAIEIKSGYGLSFESEMKMLRVIRQIKEKSPIPVKATFLGAHAIPPEFKHHRAGYVDEIVFKMLPYVAAEGLADYCDVFCDEGFFTVAETARILAAAGQLGLKGKIHANELANSGGVQVGIAHHALSVDHLERIEDAEITALLASQTIPVALPGTSFFLRIPYAPARKMIDAGLPMAIATDFNPGSTPSGNFPFLISLACIHMRMLPEEAIQAATINAAFAIQMSEQLGSITPGKQASFILSKPINSLAMIPYSYGTDLIDQVWIKGVRKK